MLKLTPVCLAALLLLQAPQSGAQGVDAAVTKQSLEARIDAAIAPYFKPGDPGATVIVTRDGWKVFRKAYGLADVAKGRPMSPNMDFRAGSITKQFTAAAIMLLVDERRLLLDDDIRKYLPDFPDKGSKITIEHLLTHTSGIVDHSTKPDFAAGMNRAMTPVQLIATFKDDPLEFAPGARYKYSNSGYVLLGEIIEKISGQPYAEFVAERIFVPLNLSDTAYDGFQRGPLLRALPYARAGDAASAWVAAAPMNISQAYAAGALATTVDDLARWNNFVSRGKLLRRASWERMFTPFKLNNGETSKYGFGWELGSLRGHPLISHGGAINGYSGYTMRLPQDRVYVAVLSNANVGSGVAPPFVVASKAAAIAIGQPYPEYKTIALPADALRAFEGVYQLPDQRKAGVRLFNGDLMIDLPGQLPQKLLAHSAQGFLIENSLTTVEFDVGGQGAPGALTTDDGEARVAYQRIAEQLPARTAMALPAPVFDSYVGRYTVGPGLVLDVSRKGTQFFVQPSGQGAVEVFAMSEAEFFSTAVDAQLRFEKDAQGKVVRAVLRQGGREMPAVRME